MVKCTTEISTAQNHVYSVVCSSLSSGFRIWRNPPTSEPYTALHAQGVQGGLQWHFNYSKKLILLLNTEQQCTAHRVACTLYPVHCSCTVYIVHCTLISRTHCVHCTDSGGFRIQRNSPIPSFSQFCYYCHHHQSSSSWFSPIPELFLFITSLCLCDVKICWLAECCLWGGNTCRISF